MTWVKLFPRCVPYTPRYPAHPRGARRKAARRNPLNPRLILAVLVALCLLAGVPAVAGSPESSDGAALGKPTVLVFGLGSRCRYCVQLKKEIGQVTEETGDAVQFHDIRVDRDKEAVQAYRILTSPTLVFLDANGNEVFRHQGILDAAQLLERLVGLGFWAGKG